MLSWMTTAVIGLAWVPLSPVLPSWPALSAAAAVCGIGGGLSHRPALRSLLGLMMVFTLSSAWSSAYCQWRLAQLFPATLASDELSFNGVLLGPFEQRGTAARPYWRADFQLLAGQCAGDYCPPGQPRFRLNLYQAPQMHPGEVWRLRLKLRPPVGTRSPGAFDYARWLIANGYAGTGYVRAVVARLSESAGTAGQFSRWRSTTLDAAAEQLSDYRQQAVMRALLFADRRGMDNDLWRLFSSTGTSHLMAISGMHIGIVLAWGMLLGRGLSMMGGGGVRSLQLSAVMGLLAALGYAAMAGFSLPTQRALVMAAVLCFTVITARQQASWSAFCVALLLVLFIDPLSVHSAGLYLSFAAVAVLLLLAQDRRWRGRPWHLAVVAQITLILALAPILTAWGFGISPVALPVNLLAIPLLALVIMPLLFAAWLSSPVPVLSHGLFSAADAVLQGLTGGLRWAAELIPLWWPQGGAIAVALGAAMAALLLLPPGIPGRLLCLPLLLLFAAYPATKPAANTAKVVVMDVGQGLSVMVQTAEHTLLYDVGPDFDSGFNSADAVLLPFFRERGIASLDRLILSHGDRDHAGSTAALLAAFSVDEVLSGEAERHRRFEARDCHSQPPWQWDGVRFQFLNTGANADDNANNRSCVLRVSVAGSQLLIPGDIEAQIEARLLPQAESAPPVLLLAAHHGSRSSSSAAWINAWQPAQVVFTASQFNRYRHPHAAVVKRYEERGAQCWQTGLHGSLEFVLGDAGITGPKPAAKRFFWQQSAKEMCAAVDSPPR